MQLENAFSLDCLLQTSPDTSQLLCCQVLAAVWQQSEHSQMCCVNLQLAQSAAP
jgi:hypothetical protein